MGFGDGVVVELDGVGVGAVVGVVVGFGVGLAVGLGVGLGVAVGEVPVPQFQVMLEGAVMVKVVAEVVPEEGTLPVPDHPEHVYPDDGEDTKAVMLSPLLCHPLGGLGLSY